MTTPQAGLPQASHHIFTGGEAAIEEDGGDQVVAAECGAVLHEGEAAEAAIQRFLELKTVFRFTWIPGLAVGKGKDW